MEIFWGISVLPPLTAVAAAMAMLFAWLAAPEAACCRIACDAPNLAHGRRDKALAWSGTCVGIVLNCGRMH